MGGAFNITTTPGAIVQTSPDGVQQVYNLADVAWVIAAVCFVFPIIPAIGFLYSGLSTRKSAAGMLFAALMTASISGVQWFLIGHSLAYSGDAGSGFIGDWRRFGYVNIESSVPFAFAIPEVLYALFQYEFAACTAAIIVGGVSGRARMAPLMVFIFLWITLVYCPIAHWVWSSSGWLYNLGVADTAGGTPVHIASGISALSLSLYIASPLAGSGWLTAKDLRPPHNPLLVLIATLLIWSGWLAFDGAGGFMALNLRSVMAASVTCLSACAGSLSWSILDYVRSRRWSIVAGCSGAIAGLVGITPACGFVGHPTAVLIGALNGVVCNYATKLKNWRFTRFHDPADVVALHFVGGVVGNMMTGFFAQKQLAALDGVTEFAGGAFIDGHWKQIGIQLADSVAATVWAFVITFILAAIVGHIPGLHWRVSPSALLSGSDEEDMEELLGEERCFEDEDIPGMVPAGSDRLSPANSVSKEEVDSGVDGQAQDRVHHLAA
ncbi:Rh-like protein/ammonium transporter [Ceraceosorus guamensis]|uniref:Rh-like protein/ammonium transporter n=1 Tax=Ceraceosorus guamensis TaxID=1522189 RepID=A0A316W381_9BASI|nr:Rh-like protein/ammonium transporter [Ceraceosorus guamensis]PWN43558.1 Rh-like protein/ammonium transporter [Ceraceosorus guamensis]